MGLFFMHQLTLAGKGANFVIDTQFAALLKPPIGLGEAMTTRAKHLRSQVQDIMRQAVVQLEEVRGTLVRTVAERLDLDIASLRKRREGLASTLKEQSEHLAEQSQLPLPQVLRSTLVRVGALLNHWAEPYSEMASTPPSAEPMVVASEGSRPPRARGKTGQPRSRKPRRPPEGDAGHSRPPQGR